MTTDRLLHQAAASAAAACLAVLLAAAPAAAADRCDGLAKQLKDQIDGMRIGQTAAGTIYLAHPRAREITLGCSGKNFSNQLFAKADRKPSPAFVDLVASAAAIIFTLPKGDMQRGASRCIRRMGFLHGDDVSTRYRRLDLRCTRTRTESTITISRSRDQ